MNSRTYLLLLLLIVYALNFADRLAIGVALQSIKLTLHLSDTELGLLTGMAFAALYAIVGVPIARWIDRGNRAKILALTAAVWSVMVVLTGRATSFAQLLLVRVGVGVGDAGSFPVAHSLIPDHFTRAERPRATAVFMLGWPVALVLGFFVAGWLNQLYGWRMMFLVIGSPGLVFAVLAWLTLKEPRVLGSLQPREHSIASGAVTACSAASPISPSSSHPLRAAQLPIHYPSMKEVLGTLWLNTTYRNLLLGYAVTSFFSAGAFQWQPAFLMRSFALQSGAVGTGLTLALGTGNLLSIYAGGWLASRFAANQERLQFRIMAGCYLFFGLDHALAYLSPKAVVSLVLLGTGSLANVVSAPLFAAIQSLVPPRMRAMSFAILLLLSSLIGLGLGPLVVGALSDALHSMFGQESLRYALLALCPGFAWGAWYTWRASTTVIGDLAMVRTHHGNPVEEEYGGDNAAREASVSLGTIRIMTDPRT